jgi:hypothetical protein
MPINDHDLATASPPGPVKSCPLSGRDQVHGPPALHAAGDHDPWWLTAPRVWITDPLDDIRESPRRDPNMRHQGVDRDAPP